MVRRAISDEEQGLAVDIDRHAPCDSWPWFRQSSGSTAAILVDVRGCFDQTEHLTRFTARADSCFGRAIHRTQCVTSGADRLRIWHPTVSDCRWTRMDRERPLRCVGPG